jgi:tetratricopeptide (TPR) repeat protein
MGSKTQSDAIPRDLTRMISEAGKFLNQGDYDQAIQILQRAHGLNPNDVEVLIDLGLAYAFSYDFQTAERYFENAILVASHKIQPLMAAGHGWLKVRNYEAAQSCFERILRQTPVPVLALFRLAEIYERSRQLDKAVEMVERVLRLEKGNDNALFMRARIHLQQGEMEAAEKLLRPIADDTRSAAHPVAWHELGVILDQQGRYDEAMAAFVKSKELVGRDILDSARAMAQLKARQIGIKQMTQTLSEKMLHRWRQDGQTLLQPPRKMALLCGHARSGTTLLEYVLDSHPQIVSAEETAVFSNHTSPVLERNHSSPPPVLPLLDAMSPRVMRHLRINYFRGMESFLRQPIGSRLLIDKNPALTDDIPVFLRLFPECKFIVALRDPRDVCLSCFTQHVEIVPDTACWLTLEGGVNNYVVMMSLWRALKPHLQDSAIEVRYEDMVEDLPSNARRVLNFLGLPWDEKVVRFHEHASSTIVRSPTYVDVTKPLYKRAVGRWRNYQKYFEPHLEKLDPFLRAFGYLVLLLLLCHVPAPSGPGRRVHGRTSSRRHVARGQSTHVRKEFGVAAGSA